MQINQVCYEYKYKHNMNLSLGEVKQGRQSCRETQWCGKLPSNHCKTDPAPPYYYVTAYERHIWLTYATVISVVL